MAAHQRYGILSAFGKRRLLGELHELTGYLSNSVLRLLNRLKPPAALEPMEKKR